MRPTQRARMGALALAFIAGAVSGGSNSLRAATESPSPASQSAQFPKPPEPYEISSFRVRLPPEVLIGSSAVGEFAIDIEVRTVAAAARAEISKLVNRLRVVVDGKDIPFAAVSIVSMEFPAPANSPATYGKILGSVAFTLESRNVGSDFFGLNWGGARLVYLADPETGLKSSFGSVKVYSSAGSQVLFGTIGFSNVLLAGFLGWRYRLFERVFHRQPIEGTIQYRPAPVPELSGEVKTDIRPRVPLPEVPKALLAALFEGRAILVLGGGASAQAGYPPGPILLELLLDRVRSRLPKDLSKSFDRNDGEGLRRMASHVGGFNKIMDAILTAVPRDEIAREMQDIFNKVEAEPSLHERLAELPWRGVLSLNWDMFAESVFTGRRSSRHGEFQTFTLDEAAELPAAVRAEHRIFLRPLGDLRRPATLSLSMDEFRRNMVRWPDFQRQIGLLLQTQTFMFIGVGADTLEQFLQSVGTDLEVANQRHYALIPDSRDNGLLSATLSRFGVSLLPYTADPDHRAVAQFVSALARSPRPSDADIRSRAKAANNELENSRIVSVKLRNIGLFDDLELKFQVSPLDGATSAPWTVIFGPNGCGKSSILRAMGLALCGSEASEAAGRLLQVGKNQGSIELQFGSGVLRTNLVRDREVIVTAAATPVQAGLVLVLGFPALRGAPSGNPRGVAKLATRRAEPADLLPMVNSEVDKRLGNFKQWLINVLEQAGRNDRRALAMKALLDGIIRDVVPGQFQKFAPLDSTYVIRVKIDQSNEPSPDDVPFDDLSQGMTSIFNWLGVLAQRLYDFYPDADQPERKSAIVMIDEIDAHLHPDWQRRLVELTKKFFPSVQVLATSHSPLLAGALRGKELCVLERDASTGKVQPMEIAIETYGMRSQHILTSPIFGLTSDRNPDLEQRIVRHVELVQTLNPTAEQETELDKLTEELKQYRYAGAKPARKLDPPTPEELETLRRHFEATTVSTYPSASAGQGSAS